MLDLLAATSDGFDVASATRAYLDTLQGPARAQSDAYFEGGYWLPLWGTAIGVLVDWLHEARRTGAKAGLLNAAAYTHTSIALLDAIKAIELPLIEVHLSDPATREAFRHISYVGMGAVDEVKGLGARGYAVALEKAAAL